MTAEPRREMFRVRSRASETNAARGWRQARCSRAARTRVQMRAARRAAQGRSKSRVEEISSGLRTARRSARTGKFKRGLSHGVRDLCRRCWETSVEWHGDISDRDAVERVTLHMTAAVAHELSAVIGGADVLTQAQSCGGEEVGNFVGKEAESPRLADLFERAQKFFGIRKCCRMIEG